MSRSLETLVEMFAQTPMEHGPSDASPSRCGLTPVAQMPGHDLEAGSELEVVQSMTYHCGENSIGENQWHAKYSSAKKKEKMYFLADDSITCIMQEERVW